MMALNLVCRCRQSVHTIFGILFRSTFFSIDFFRKQITNSDAGKRLYIESSWIYFAHSNIEFSAKQNFIYNYQVSYSVYFFHTQSLNGNCIEATKHSHGTQIKEKTTRATRRRTDSSCRRKTIYNTHYSPLWEQNAPAILVRQTILNEHERRPNSSYT